MHICPRCNERPTKKGYCSSCRSEYSRIWKSNHKKSPPKGELKGNWRRAEKDFELPPITMCYLTPKGGMLCACKTEMHYIGTRTTAEDRESQFFCSRCCETVFIPHCIYPRLRIWAETPNIWADYPSPIRQNGEGDSVSGNGYLRHLLLGGLP